VLDQAAFRPLYANTVNPEPDRTAEEDYQQRLIEASENHLQLEGVLVGGDLFEKRLVSLRQIVAVQLEWQLSQAMQNGEAEHFKIVGLQEDLDRYHEQLRIELVTARSTTTQSQATIQQELAQAAATALTRQVEAERQAGAMATRLATVEEQL